MRANQESWFRSCHGEREREREREGLCDMSLVKTKENKRRKKP